MRAHLQRAAKNTGEVDPLLKVEWPRVGLPLWRAFQRIGRPSTFNGHGQIQPENILAYQELHGVRFTAWELEVIEAFDAIAQEAMHKGEKSG